MTMATGVDLVAAGGSNLTSPAVMLASNKNPQIRNRTPHRKIQVQNPSSRGSNERKSKRGNEKTGFTHSPSSQNQGDHQLRFP